MTTLSRVPINPQLRQGRRLLTNPQAMHAAVLSCFPQDTHTDTSRVLWRIDQVEKAFTLYIVGPEIPDLRVITEQAGWPSRPGQSTDYVPFLDRLMAGQEWRFRLSANPVKSIPSMDGSRGKVVPHVTREQQVNWLVTRAAVHGFELLGDTGDDAKHHVTVTRSEDLRFRRGESTRPVSLRRAQFDGALRVTDAEQLRASLQQGIGRARAYGCGLLTLAPLRS
ncbi:type I-E CRISPR-associated protein Cas6/Cse3/CasE [Brachybacterium muris]|uniref:type I-E CRISPR-associated protein Cas6/Cse3/CasE n=1 Tax=Brachybacterium muris TaxID=219301 RepID=UPI0021A3EB38|nr:type I-E CRISPR-associated protein Cas6/Cse3/CasE [Brachybacterium muris]MCT1996747.1 type I-E CRISPR-associated protein Cas6/Cse3/CasE [Brachybacterium muris]